TGHDVVDAERHGRDGVQQPAEGAAEDADEHPDPRAPLVAGPRARPRPEDHHALETDVDHAGPLGPEPAEPGQEDRDGEAQRGADRPAGGHGLGVVDDADQRQQDQQPGRDQQVVRPAQPSPAVGGRAHGGRLGRDAHEPLPVDSRARSCPVASPVATVRCCRRISQRRTSSYTMTTVSTTTPCMTPTISFGTSTDWSTSEVWSRNANSSAASAMPTGWLRPSSAIVMPVKPSPAGKFSEYS